MWTILSWCWIENFTDMAKGRMIEHGILICRWCMINELWPIFGKISHSKLSLQGRSFTINNVPISQFIFSSHTRRKKTDLQFQITNIYYTKESPRNKEYDKYPYFKHVVKPQDDIVGYYALKQDFKYVVLRKAYHSVSDGSCERIFPKVDDLEPNRTVMHLKVTHFWNDE